MSNSYDKLINSIDEQNILYTDVRSVLKPYLLTYVPKKECEIIEGFFKRFDTIAAHDICLFYLVDRWQLEFEVHFRHPENLERFRDFGELQFTQYILSEFGIDAGNYYIANMGIVNDDLEDLYYAIFGSYPDDNTDSE